MTRKILTSLTNDSKDEAISSPILIAITDIQHKIMNSSALNGGFDTLVFKVDRIEEAQGHIVNKVDEVHDALYKPDDGLFARVAEVKQSKTEEINDIENKIYAINLWKENHAITVQQTKDLEKKVDELTSHVKVLQSSKSKYDKVVVWALVALGGGGVSLLGKLLYDFISGHVQLV